MTTTVSYITQQYKTKNGFTKRVKCTDRNPKDFKVGDRYIVLTESDPHVKIVETVKQAGRMNESILNADSIRRVVE